MSFSLKNVDNFCIGVNWGMIEKSNGKLFGLNLFEKRYKPVDLDLSLGIFDLLGNLVEVVSHNNLEIEGFKHFGDDEQGDKSENDNIDNEIIQINISKIPSSIRNIAIILNSLKGASFSEIPYSTIRIYQGDNNTVKKVFNSFEITEIEDFKNSKSIILGQIVKNEEDYWTFNYIGKSIQEKNLENSLKRFQKEYL